MRQILFRGPYRGDVGYAVGNRNYLFALAGAGNNIYLEPTGWGTNDTPMHPLELPPIIQLPPVENSIGAVIIINMYIIILIIILSIILVL